ncbi:MAG: 4'-phosphopantetheinyl transferase superfamily protein [Acidimicrobiia bacterium]|nr:4'-phosphopantetheinyl transferase superfamily protein [Acidimicrobiia bacterium]
MAHADSSPIEPVRAPRFEALFAGATVTVFRTDRLIPDAPLSAEETQFIENAVPGRKAEFATGRACARAAIEALGLEAPTIPVGERRQPVWPEGVSAAITHTRREQREFVAAVATVDEGGQIGIGIDAEVIQPLKDGVRDMLLVPDEIKMVEELLPGQRDEGAIRVFSAKEAFYKAQYALTASWVGFGDMRLSTLDGSGELLETGHLPALTIIERPIRFHQVVHDGLVVSGVAVRLATDT